MAEGGEPSVDRMLLKSDQAMNAAIRDLALGHPQVERGRLDIEPGRDFVGGSKRSFRRQATMLLRI